MKPSDDDTLAGVETGSSPVTVAKKSSETVDSRKKTSYCQFIKATEEWQKVSRFIMANILGSVTRLDKSNAFVAVFNGRKIEDDSIVYQSATRQHATLEGAVKQARAGMGAKGEVYAHPMSGVDNLWLLSDAPPATPVEKAAEKSTRAK